jgi:hypothetical protein
MTREPPLFSLLALTAEKIADLPGDNVATQGLSAFTGYELAFAENEAVDRKLAARLVTWLARSALIGIDLKPGQFLGPDGAGLCELELLNGSNGRPVLVAHMVNDHARSD